MKVRVINYCFYIKEYYHHLIKKQKILLHLI